MVDSLASYSPYTWTIISWESENILIWLTLISLAMFKPAINASYSAPLLVMWKLNFMVHFETTPPWLMRINSAPYPWEFEAPSAYKIYEKTTKDFLSSTSNLFPSSSSRICTFMLKKGLYSISNFPSSMAHLANLPDVSGLQRMDFKG